MLGKHVENAWKMVDALWKCGKNGGFDNTCWTWPWWPLCHQKNFQQVAVSTRRSLARGSQRPCQNGNPCWQKQPCAVCSLELPKKLSKVQAIAGPKKSTKMVIQNPPNWSWGDGLSWSIPPSQMNTNHVQNLMQTVQQGAKICRFSTSQKIQACRSLAGMWIQRTCTPI